MACGACKNVPGGVSGCSVCSGSNRELARQTSPDAQQRRFGHGQGVFAWNDSECCTPGSKRPGGDIPPPPPPFIPPPPPGGGGQPVGIPGSNLPGTGGRSWNVPTPNFSIPQPGDGNVPVFTRDTTPTNTNLGPMLSPVNPSIPARTSPSFIPSTQPTQPVFTRDTTPGGGGSSMPMGTLTPSRPTPVAAAADRTASIARALAPQTRPTMYSRPAEPDAATSRSMPLAPSSVTRRVYASGQVDAYGIPAVFRASGAVTDNPDYGTYTGGTKGGADTGGGGSTPGFDSATAQAGLEAGARAVNVIGAAITTAIRENNATDRERLHDAALVEIARLQADASATQNTEQRRQLQNQIAELTAAAERAANMRPTVPQYETSQERQVADNSQQSSNRNLYIGLAVGGGVLLIGGVGAYVYMKKSKKAEAARTNPYAMPSYYDED